MEAQHLAVALQSNLADTMELQDFHHKMAPPSSLENTITRERAGNCERLQANSENCQRLQAMRSTDTQTAKENLNDRTRRAKGEVVRARKKLASSLGSSQGGNASPRRHHRASRGSAAQRGPEGQMIRSLDRSERERGDSAQGPDESRSVSLPSIEPSGRTKLLRALSRVGMGWGTFFRNYDGTTAIKHPRLARRHAHGHAYGHVRRIVYGHVYRTRCFLLFCLTYFSRSADVGATTTAGTFFFPQRPIHV